MNNSPINLDDIRIPDAEPVSSAVPLSPVSPRPASAPPAARPRRQQDWHTRGWFVKGPISGPWIEIACRLPGRALHVAIAIWFRHGFRGEERVTVPESVRDKFSLSPDTWRRGLAALEGAGLVAVERRSGRPSLVTLLETSATDDSGGQAADAVGDSA